MFGPIIEILLWLRDLLPTRASFRRPHFNFLTLHYIYLISFTIVCSIIIYPAKNMDYIDALFQSSGAATQSGLNTVDLNTIYLYQQITFYFVACVCNPIFINTFVVFVRLYWFEKRFQNIVLESHKLRKTRTRERSFSKAEGAEERDNSWEERRVGSHTVNVMRPGDKVMEVAKHYAGESDSSGGEQGESEQSARNTGSAANSSPEKDEPPLNFPEKIRREITFADEIKPVKTEEDRLPSQRSPEQHIAFLENQRNPKDHSVLYIPGPRDFDRGDQPQSINEEEEDLFQLRQNARILSDKDFEDFEKHKANGRTARRGSVVSKFNPFSRESSQAKEDSDGLRHRRRNSFVRHLTTEEDDDDYMPPYLSWQPTLGRNSTFVDLTEEQREELGGIEYRALKTLAIVLVCYFLGFHVLGVVCFVPWILRSSPYYQNVLAEAGSNKTWWGIFTPASCFNDLGYTLTPDSMLSFQTATFPLLLGSFLILIGNTGFPCMLRFVIWSASKLVPRESALYEELRFLLDHPRRCFTLLFPSKATWWLFWILVLLNGIDVVLFIVLDLHDPVVTMLSPANRVLDGWFQATSTRTAGFAVVNLAGLHPGIQVSYLVMMYISAFPIAISVRRTNVYEERSLGIYGGEDEDEGSQSYVGDHLRRQLSFDLWFVFLGFFIISIVEGGHLSNTNEYAFTLFSVLFEIVSAYGTVGLSLGYPGINASFSTEFSTLSKLVIIAMQIRGRHRGLPYALDKAILLPSEGLHKKEVQDAERRRRRGSTIDVANGGGGGELGPAPGSAVGTPSPMTYDKPVRRSSTIQTARDDRQEHGGGLARLLSAALSAGPPKRRATMKSQ